MSASVFSRAKTLHSFAANDWKEAQAGDLLTHSAVPERRVRPVRRINGERYFRCKVVGLKSEENGAVGQEGSTAVQFAFITLGNASPERSQEGTPVGL